MRPVGSATVLNVCQFCRPPGRLSRKTRTIDCKNSLKQQQQQAHSTQLHHTCRSTKDGQNLQPLHRGLLLPAGLMGIASLLCWSQYASAADVQHHLRDLGSGMHNAHMPSELFQLSSEEDFWGNVYAYIRYFFSVLLGTAYIAVKPIAGLFKRPVTAIITVAALVLLFVFVSTTVNAMLGLSDVTPFEPLNTMTNLES